MTALGASDHDQLSLFDLLEPNGNGRLTRDQAGLVHATPIGAERLLAALVKRGLPEGDLRVAAALCLTLDRGVGK